MHSKCWQCCEGGSSNRNILIPARQWTQGITCSRDLPRWLVQLTHIPFSKQVSRPKHERPPAGFPYFFWITLNWTGCLILSCFETTYFCLLSGVCEAQGWLTSLKDTFLPHYWRNVASYPGNLNTKEQFTLQNLQAGIARKIFSHNFCS